MPEMIKLNELSREDVIIQEVNDYLEQFDADNHPEPSEIRAKILDRIRNKFSMVNAMLGKGNKWQIPTELPNEVVALILSKLHHVVLISMSDTTHSSQMDMLGVYMEYCNKHGTYSVEDEALAKLCQQYKESLTESDFKNISYQLRLRVDKKSPCDDPNLIAVNNGIFDYKNKQLLPFTPDEVFLTKSPVNYSPHATNPIITDTVTGETWDMESWVRSLSDDDDIVHLLWEMIGAAIRPGIPWNKAVFLISETGNNGKGTLCQLIRNLCGLENCVSLQLSDMGKEFLLEPLVHASAIITDENDVNTYVDKAAAFKAIITHDVVQVNRKYKTPISFKFRGFMLQCLNDFPEFKDKSESLQRRILMVPMTKCFTGAENKNIKSDYLCRQNVLEYVMYRVLNMNYYELSEPESCKYKKEEFKESNDSVLQFAHDILHELVWDLQPFEFLYDLYKAWMAENNPTGKPISRNSLTRKLKSLVDQYPQWGWTYLPGNKEIRVKGMMNEPEPLILKYDLEKWKNDYKGIEKLLSARPACKGKYRGLIRATRVDTCEQCEPGPEPEGLTDKEIELISRTA